MEHPTPFLTTSATTPARLAIFMSGSGTNAEQVIRRIRDNGEDNPVEIVALVTDAPDTSRTRELGGKYSLNVVANDIRDFYRKHGETRVSIRTPAGRELRQQWTDSLRKQLEPLRIDFAVFAGFVPLTNITADFPCLNVHPGDLTYLKDGSRYLVGLHTVPIERALLQGLEALRSSVIIAVPYTGAGEDMDSGPILGISSPVPVELAGTALQQLQQCADKRPAKRPKGGYGDKLEEIAKLNQENLKRSRSMGRLPFQSDNGMGFPGQEAWLNHFYPSLDTLFDYVPQEGVIIVFDPPRVESIYEKTKKRFREDVEKFREEAAQKGTIKMYLLTDSAQKLLWPKLKPTFKEGDALYFSHGFSIVYREQTGVIPPANIDVILVAPKGSGTSVRANFVAGSGINSSFAVHQNATGKADDRVKAIGIAIGSGYLFPTTFEKETYSDLTGERGVLMGALAGIMEAQYNCLRENGHSPSEAFNETVEELTQSLIRLVDQNGMDWMYNNCSETARIGALRWRERFRDTTKPLFDCLYEFVACGEEVKIVLDKSTESDYKKKLAEELQEMGNSEMWKAGKTVRSLRPRK